MKQFLIIGKQQSDLCCKFLKLKSNRLFLRNENDGLEGEFFWACSLLCLMSVKSEESHDFTTHSKK